MSWLRSAGTVTALVLLASLVAVPAFALDGVHHNPTGIDDLYSSEPTERVPRDPMAGEPVQINATTWPVEPGQTVWVTWTRNGVSQTPVGAAWDHNSGDNSYWKINLGTFARGDKISYTVNADVNGGGQRSTGPFAFTVTSWSTVTNVTGFTDNGTSVDVTTGDSAGASPRRSASPSPRSTGSARRSPPAARGSASPASPGTRWRTRRAR
ncbi:hypothetical protein ACFQ0B_51380 [Nonomuraea thailandensis]